MFHTLLDVVVTSNQIQQMYSQKVLKLVVSFLMQGLVKFSVN